MVTKLTAMDEASAMADSVTALAHDRAAPIIDWLLRDRVRALRTTRFMHEYCSRLHEVAGVPADRVTFHVRQLHPQFQAVSTLWNRESGGAVMLPRDFSVQDSPAFLRSPVRGIFEGGPARDWHLERMDSPPEFGILDDLKRQGYTHYTIRPLPMSTGQAAAQSFATRRTGGFSAIDIAVMDALTPALGSVIELAEVRRTSQMLLNTYVGRHAGARVMRGRIRRGDGDIIKAVVWLCDLRGFTALSETLALGDVIQHLNTYFDTIGAPIQKNGGEILKFIGDAILAIFPVEQGEADMSGACERAARAAREALDAKTRLNGRRNIVGCPPFDCGIALHVGEVMYGNVGAAERLDFTVIGPAVNLVARLEPLTAVTGQPVVVSRQFAEIAKMTCQPLGTFPLKGISEPQSVYALPFGIRGVQPGPLDGARPA